MNDDRYVPKVIIKIRSFHHALFITWFVAKVARRVSIVEQELLTLPAYLGLSPIFSGVRVANSLVLCVVIEEHYFPFVFFLLSIVLSVL